MTAALGFILATLAAIVVGVVGGVIVEYLIPRLRK